MRAFLFAALLAIFVLPHFSENISAQIQESQWADRAGFFRDRAVTDLRILENCFYLATRAELYIAHDGQKRWDSVFSLPRGSNEINCIAAAGPRCIYIGTTRGLFKSEDAGGSWRNVFKAINPAKSNILSIAVRDPKPDEVLIASQQGVFLSCDGGRSWRDISTILRNKTIKSVAINHTGFYAGGEGGLFFTGDKGLHWERLLVTNSASAESKETEGEDYKAEEPIVNQEVRYITTDDSYIYAAIDKVIYNSKLGERAWEPLAGEGITGYINYILPSGKDHKIFAATTKGVFEYMEDGPKWEKLDSGAGSIDVKKITFESDGEEVIWAAADKGLIRLETTRYVIEKRQEVENQLKSVFIMADGEPTFHELRQAAIRYAEVSPEKIKRWRSESRYRALFPRVSLGLGRNRSNNSEIYTSATKDYVVVGPDDVANNLDLSLSWELGDLIWNDDQTNIDVRSRLMVQLRNDILDDLRRAYYERKKLQFELAVNPPKDIKTRFEKGLRLQELTSTMDDLTGNYLSEAIARRQKK